MAGSISGDLSGTTSGDISGNLSGGSSISGNLTMPSGIIDGEIVDELRDIRVGADGTVYDSAGIAVRTQVQTIDDSLSNKVDKVSGKELSANDFTNYYRSKISNTNITYCTCSTSSNVAAKVATVPSGANTNFSLIAGSIIAVKFSYTNSANNPTLSVLSLGAKRIRYSGGLIYSVNLYYAGTAGRTILYMYNGTEWVFLGWDYDQNTTYSDATQSSHGLMSVDDKKALDKLSQSPELIADVTTSEDLASVVVDTDINGQSFDIRMLKAIVHIPESLTGTNDYILANLTSKASDGVTTYFGLPTMRMHTKDRSINYYEVETFGGGLFFSRGYTSSYIASSSSAITSFCPDLSDVASFTSFKISQYSSTTTLIPSGTRIVLYGIRV